MLLDPEWEVARFRKHVAISDTYALWPNSMAIQYGLYVSGSSRFLSGGTYVSTNAIEAVGDISGTTDLYTDGNMYSATTNLLEIFSTIGMSGTVTSVAISGSDGIEIDSGFSYYR